MKGLAPQQIALLVLAILVLAIVAYLLYRTFISGSNQLTAEECRAEATRLCTACKLENIGQDPWTVIPCAQGEFLQPNGGCVAAGTKIGITTIDQPNCKKVGI